MNSAGAPASSEEASSSRFALAILFLVLTLNLFDRQLINILAQDIKIDLHLSDAELGLLTGTAFGLLKALFSVPVGAWADRSDRGRILAALVALFSAFTLLSAAALGFAGLILARMGVGLGESATVPVASAIVRERFSQRATSALAIAMAGNPVGSFLAFLVGGLIAQAWGWRWAFLVAGPPGLLLAWIVLAKLGGGKPAARSKPQPVRSWPREALTLVRQPGFKPLMCATAGSMFMVSATNAWMPAFLIRMHELTTAEAGLYVAIAVGLGGALGAASGIACDGIRARLRRPESAMMVTTLLLAAPFLALMIFSGSRGPALSAFFIYNMVAYAWLAPTIRLIQDAVEPGQRSLALSLCSAVAIFLGLGVGIPAIGWVSDLLSSAFGPLALGVSLCLVVSLAIAISLFAHLYILTTAGGAAADLDKSLSPFGKPGIPSKP